jgi:hypothetical protein
MNEIVQLEIRFQQGNDSLEVSELGILEFCDVCKKKTKHTVRPANERHDNELWFQECRDCLKQSILL